MAANNITFPIYNADGTSFNNLVLKKAVYDSVVMSLGDKITGDVYYKDNTLAVTMSEYIEFKANPYDDNEDAVRFVLVNPPTVVREGIASDNSELRGMTKYSFVFYHPMYMLGNFPFTDVAVSSDQNKYLSQNKKFSWMGTGLDLIDKLNKNLDGTQWFVVASDDEESQSKLRLFPSQIQANGKNQTEKDDVLTFDNQYISDVLKTFYDNWETPFVIDKIKEGEYYFTDDQGQRIDWYSQAGGSKRFVIVFGLPSNQILDGSGNEFVFQFGKNVGLKNNSRTQKNNKIITRIAGYGSENNIPYGYPQIQWYGNQSWDYTIDNDPNNPNSYPIYRGIVNGQYVKLIKHPFTRSALMPTVYVNSVFNKVSPYLSNGNANPNYSPNTTIVDYYDAIDDATHTYPNNIVQNAPSFEIHQFENIKPELTSKQIVAISAYDNNEKDSITVQQFTAFMNAEIAAYDDITARYLTEMLNAFNVTPHTNTQHGFTGGSYTYEWSLTFDGNYCKAFYNSPVTMFQKTVKVANAAVDWDDSMDDDGKYKQPYFKITLPRLDFDLYACAAITEEMEINMRSGACMGCTFTVQVDWDDYKKNFYDSNGNFAPNGSQRDLAKYPNSNLGQITVVVAKDIDTFGTILPDSYRQPSGGDEGDKFVILGISLPLSYVTSAQTRLDEAMKEYMLENNVYYYDYPLKFDEYFLATHESILAQMRNNSVVAFVYGNEPTKKLYIKQITVKYGDKPLPTYDITLTDDVEIVLNQIGQVTDDVSRVRLQMSELQKYYGINLSNLIEEKLSRVSDDVAQGRITFQQGLDALGSVIFGSEIKSSDYVQGMTDQGRGWRIDEQGNAEMESLRVRSYLEVIELLINRLQAQEGDTLFTDNDQIIHVEQKTYNSSTYYKLTLKEKWEGYTTCQKNGNVIKGIINTLAANAGNVSDVTPQQSVETDGDNKYYTSWMRVVDPSNFGDTNGTNQICVVLYSDSDTPANKNFQPCELMNIARWGCALNPNEQGISASEKADRKRRQNLFMISTSDGRLVKLNGVNTPKLSNGNYGTTLGELPDFVKAYPAVAQRLVDGGDYLYAQGIVVGDFIKIDVNGVPVVNYVDQGEWQDNTTYLCNEYNSTTKQYETHDVWHNNALWRCLQHEPVTVGGVTTYYEPTEQNSAYWQKLMEGTSGADYIYLRGSGGVGTREVNVNGGENLVSHSSSSAGGTGIELTIINRQTLAKVSSTTYNTYSESGTALPALVAALQALDDTVFVCLTSCNATEWSNELVNALTSFGLEAYDYENDPHRQYPAPEEWLGARSPFVFLGYLGLEQGYGIFVQQYAAPSPLDAEASVFVSNGLFVSAKNGEDGTSVSKTGADTYRYAVSASGSTTPSTWYATKQAAIDAYTGTTGGTWPKNTFMWTETTIHWNTGNTILYNAERNPSDGTNAFVVDLDPQMSSVALDANGNTSSAVDFYFYPRAYYGSTPVISDCTLSIDTQPTNITVTPDNTNKRFRVQINSGVAINEANDIICTVTHATYGSRTVTFRLAGVKGGANGSPAVLQELTPNLSAISFARTDADELTPSYRELSFSIKKTEGSATSTQTISQSGLTVRWSVSSMPATSSGGNAWGSGTVTGITWNSGSMRVANSIAYINIYVASFNSSGTLVDMETIPIVKDGKLGTSVKYAYAYNEYPTNPSEGDVVLLNYPAEANDMIDVYEDGEWQGYSVPYGTIYICIKDEHSYEATANGWVDRGKFTGDDGENAATALASPDKLVVPCDSNGASYGLSANSISFTLKVGSDSNVATITSITYGTLPTGVSVSGSGTSTRSISVDTSASASGMAAGVTFTVTGTFGGKTYTATVTVALIGASKGDTGVGQRGKTGRFYYYATEWDATNTTLRYTANDAQSPYFKVGNSFYVYVGEDNFTDKTMYEINRDYGAPSSSNNNFAIMTNDFDYLITKAIFGDYAQFGANIINGDFRFSQYGYMRGLGEKNVQITNGTQYQNISETDPFGENDIYDSENDSRKKANMSFVSTNIDFWTCITQNYYSVIGNNIEFSTSQYISRGHNVYQSGDTYYRYKLENGSGWVDGFKAISVARWTTSNNPAASADAASLSGWQQGVPAVTAKKPYLWLRTSSTATTAYRVSSKIPTFEITAGKYYTIEIDLKADESYSDLYIGVGSVYNSSPSYIMSGSDLKIVKIDNERVAVYATFYCGTSGEYINLFIKSERDVTFAALYECQFVPYLVEDLKQGRIVARNIEAKGELHAESLSYQVKNGKGLVVSDESIITLGYDNLNAQITLPTPSEAKGRVIEIYSGINQFDENNIPISPVFKLGYTGATSNTYFRALTMGNSYYRQANFQNWPESYLKLWSDGTDWYVVRAEQTVYDSTNYQFMIKLLTKTIPNGL